MDIDKSYDIVVKSARDFAHRRLLPTVIERDNAQRFATEEVKEMGSLGFMGMVVPLAYGGSGMDFVSYVLAIREIAKVDASVAICMSVNNSLVCAPLVHSGSESLKQKYLPRLSSGEILGAFCLSEPECGSDASAMDTQAKREDNHYILHGTKNWITNGGSADVYIVFAQSDKSLGAKGINAFVVEKDWPGVHLGKKEDKMGIRSSDTHSVSFEKVRVPIENRIGEERSGFHCAMQTLDGGRIGVAAQALGIASGALALSVQYSKERKSFGKYLHEHQIIAHKLAIMATKIHAAEGLVLDAARKQSQKEPYSLCASIAKYYASSTAMDVTTEAVQIHGGYGYVKEFHVERLMRDAKITQIYEGTSEMQQLVIARHILS